MDLGPDIENWTSDQYRKVRMNLIGRLRRNYFRWFKRLGWGREFVQDWLEDIASDALELARQSLDKWDPERESFQYWIFLKGRMLARDTLMKTERRQTLFDDWRTTKKTFEDPIDELICSECEIFALLEELKPEQAEAISLYYLHGLEVREAAWILGCPEKTFYTILNRGRKKALAYLKRVAADEKALENKGQKTTEPSEAQDQHSQESSGPVEMRPPPPTDDDDKCVNS